MDGDIIFTPLYDIEDISIKKSILEEGIIGPVDFVPMKMPTDGHWVTHCFSKRFNESAAQFLEKLWEEIVNRIDKYIEFGE